MTNVACFCGSVYSFSGDIGACPECGEYASFTRVSTEEERQMRDELALVFAEHEGGVRAIRSSRSGIS